MLARHRNWKTKEILNLDYYKGLNEDLSLTKRAESYADKRITEQSVKNVKTQSVIVMMKKYVISTLPLAEIIQPSTWEVIKEP